MGLIGHSELRYHSLAAIFPMMDKDGLAGLARDISTNGLTEDIVLLEGQILDGRNRYQACLRVGVEPRFTQFEGDNPQVWVISKNLHRRHLTESQRALIAARISNWKRGANQHTATQADLPVWKASSIFAVSQRSITRAMMILKSGHPDLIERVMDGRIRLHRADKISRVSHDQQRIQLQASITVESTAGESRSRVAGRSYASIRWSDLPLLIDRADREAEILRAIFARVSNPDASLLVSDHISPASLREITGDDTSPGVEVDSHGDA